MHRNYTNYPTDTIVARLARMESERDAHNARREYLRQSVLNLRADGSSYAAMRLESLKKAACHWGVWEE